MSPTPDQPSPDTPPLSAAALFALAERVVSWEDDASRSQLQHCARLYAQAAQRACAELSELGARVAPPTLAEAGRVSDGELRSGLLRLRADTSALLAQLAAARRARVKRPAYVYPGLALLLVALLALGLQLAREPLVSALDLGNLSQRKPWRTSSSANASIVDHGLLSTPLGLYFIYTAHEREPWLEIDLLRETRIRSVQVKNRQDCCEEQAVPLVLEVSSDHRSWRKLAEQRSAFDTWQVRLPATSTRWVRLRVRAETSLALHSVVVRSL